MACYWIHINGLINGCPIRPKEFKFLVIVLNLFDLYTTFLIASIILSEVNLKTVINLFRENNICVKYWPQIQAIFCENCSDHRQVIELLVASYWNENGVIKR